MEEKDSKPESFEDFKNSFSYGSRSDLNFKFLKQFSSDEAAEFVRDLLAKIGESMDDGNYDRVVRHVVKGQIDSYATDPKFVYDSGPFSPHEKAVSESQLTLITSTGHFVEEDDPKPFGIKNMSQKEAVDRIQDFLKEEPKLSAIPFNTAREKLTVRHGGYDIHGVQTDPNVGFPYERCLELKNEGMIGDLTPEAYSFVGACSQKRLLNKTGPDWVKRFQELGLDAALLVPV